MLAKILFLILGLNSTSFTNDCVHSEKVLNCVKYVRNYDGDTINFSIPNVHPYFGKKFQVRLENVDTAEIRTKNECEKAKARSAQRLVQSLLKQAQRIDIKLNYKEKDPHGRHIARVTYDGKDLSNVLLKNKLAYKYNGKRKPAFDWCNY